ncbi:endonuclease domain-containing protein [Deinococcus arcticus]|uniref:DNA (Cytosine-5-)-methyltransferase n=1 Tax=Deinococcus arcticus TaxID=2136176 RepID=A0A2T3W4E2_9DEIO|nr:endonuclease domain-containing protein [Deinococcus arcticus]PTA66633.1 DNA (cytosine-5-)-methyltransferase [Deinococcus arcticus]
MERFPRDEQNRRARELRRNMTPEEKMLWQRLRGNQLGVAFRRQQALGFYFADFVCFEKRLVIELDGGQHAGSRYDAVRDSELRARGFRVLRFWNNEVAQNLEGVLAQISGAL